MLYGLLTNLSKTFCLISQNFELKNFLFFELVILSKIKKSKGSSFSTKIKLDNLSRDFITKCLNDDPEKRLTVEQALNHPFIANYDIDNSNIMPSYMENNLIFLA